MKLLIMLVALMSLASCGKETKEKYCTNEYVSNSEGTECICPTDTHTEVTFKNEDSVCLLKTVDFYLCTLSGDLCFNGGDFTAFDGNGYAQLYYDTFDSFSMTFGDGDEYVQLFTDENIFDLDDGSIEVTMTSFHLSTSDNCFDWATRAEDCPKNVRGYIHGISNPDKSIIDLNVEWKDCDGTVLNTGTIHLKKP